MNKSVLCTAAALLICCAPAASADTYSTALAQCLYKNASTNDRDLLTQWAFVTIGRTDAAKKVTVIPQTKIDSVSKSAQKALTTLAVKKCGKELAAVALHNPKTGLQDSATALAETMIEEAIRERATSLLPTSVLSSGSLGISNTDATKLINGLGSFLKK